MYVYHFIPTSGLQWVIYIVMIILFSMFPAQMLIACLIGAIIWTMFTHWIISIILILVLIGILNK